MDTKKAVVVGGAIVLGAYLLKKFGDGGGGENPTVTLNPVSPVAGQQMQIILSGWPANIAVAIDIDDEHAGGVYTDANGAKTANIVAPAAGSHTLLAWGGDGISVSVNFTTTVEGGGETYGPAFILGAPVMSVSQYPNPTQTTMPHAEATITNNSGQKAKHRIGLYVDYYSQYIYPPVVLNYDDWYLAHSEVLVELNPGQSYHFVWDNYDAATNTWAGADLYRNYADFFLIDELGNRSQMTRMQV